MRKLVCLLLGMALLWGGTAQAILVDPYDNALAPDGVYGLLYGNYYHADEFTGPDGDKAVSADLSAYVSLVRVIGYKKIGKLPAAFQIILPFGKIEEKKFFKESSEGIGDLTFGPGVFLYNNDDTRTYVSYWFYAFAPTGDFDKDRVINLGRNHWSFEHQIAINKQYKGLVYDMNLNYYHHTEESKTKLERSDRFELETSIAYQLNDKLVLGINGGGYADFGKAKIDGVSAADTRAERWQVGPSIGYTINERMGVNFRWSNDVSATNDSKGNDIWLRVNYAF